MPAEPNQEWKRTLVRPNRTKRGQSEMPPVWLAVCHQWKWLCVWESPPLPRSRETRTMGGEVHIRALAILALDWYQLVWLCPPSTLLLHSFSFQQTKARLSVVLSQCQVPSTLLLVHSPNAAGAGGQISIDCVHVCYTVQRWLSHGSSSHRV